MEAGGLHTTGTLTEHYTEEICFGCRVGQNRIYTPYIYGSGQPYLVVDGASKVAPVGKHYLKLSQRNTCDRY